MGDNSKTWHEMLFRVLSGNDESFSDIVYTTLTDEEWDAHFDAGYSGIEGAPFTVWTKEWVYFPTCYDGSEGVASVPRNPRVGHATGHIGGG